MKIFTLTDADGRIIGLNPNDMTGNTGWTEAVMEAAMYETMFERLTDGHGIPRYKLVDGQAVERTAEEIAADIAALPPPPMTQEQINQANREAIEALIAVVLGGGST